MSAIYTAKIYLSLDEKKAEALGVVPTFLFKKLKTVKSNKRSIPLKHKYMTAHFPDLVHRKI